MMKIIQLLSALLLLGCVSEPAEDTLSVDFLVEQDAWGLVAELPFDVPSIVRFGKTSGLLTARIDGHQASKVHLKGRVLTLEYRDDFDRRLTFVGELNAGEVTGDSSRCLDGCDRGSFRMRPLLSSEASELEQDQQEAAMSWDEGGAFDVTLHEDHAYVVRPDDGLRVISLTESEESVSIEAASAVAAPFGDLWNDVKVADGYAYVSSAESGMVVIDVSEPTEPHVVVSQFPLVGGSDAHNIYLSGDRAFIARVNQTGGLAIVDVSEPLQPSLLGQYGADGCEDVHDVSVVGDQAYLACSNLGFVTLDISDPERPRRLSTIPGIWAHSVVPTTVDGQALLLGTIEDYAGQLIIFERTPSGQLEQLSTWSLGGAASIHHAACDGPTCWITYYQEGVVELDLSTPEAPVARRRWSTSAGDPDRFFSGASGVAASASHVFIADTSSDLLVFPRSSD